MFFAELFGATTSVKQKQTIFTATEEQLFCGTAFLRWPSIFIEHCFRRVCRSSHRRCSIKKENFQNSHENTYARFFFTKVAGQKPTILLKRRLWHRWCEFWEIFKSSFFLRTPPRDCFWTCVTLKIESNDRCSERFVLVWRMLFFITNFYVAFYYHFLRSILF